MGGRVKPAVPRRRIFERVTAQDKAAIHRWSRPSVGIEPGSPKFGSWLHSTAAGVFIVGAAAGVDVVTP
jgi:hypothetical protein